MSNFSNIHDFLLHNQKLHSRIAGFYRDLSLKTNDERVKLLLNILQKHELKLVSSVGDYLEKASAKVLDTFVQYDYEKSIEHLFNIESLDNQISSDAVEILAHDFDRYLSELYAGMLEATECEKVQELFENLGQHMVQEKKRLTVDINSMADM